MGSGMGSDTTVFSICIGMDMIEKRGDVVPSKWRCLDSSCLVVLLWVKACKRGCGR